MKIRNGFVSNSSSSSFILKFDELPKNVHETRLILFGENPPIFTSYWDDDAISTEQVSEILFNDIKSSYIMDINDVLNAIKNEAHFSEWTGDDVRNLVVGTEFIDEYDKIYNKIIEKDREFNRLSWDYKKENNSWENHHKEIEEMSKPLIDIIEKCVKDKYDNKSIKFIQVEYSDNDGVVFSYMEHGGVLDKITVQRFSHH